MERRQVYAALGLIAVTQLFVGCRDSTPVPTPSPVTSVAPAFSLSGRVVDTAYRPVGGAHVQVIAGPGAGTATTTDHAGRFSMPGAFTGRVTVTASKDGYVPETKAIPLPGGPLRPPVDGWEVQFYLAPVGPTADITGEYTLTLTADSACTNLSDEARTRTYTATIVPGGRPSSFLARLSDARFLSPTPWCNAAAPVLSCSYNTLAIGIAGDFASVGSGIVEQLGDTIYLWVGAGSQASFGPTGFTAPLSGIFLYCPSEPFLIDQGTWACRAGDGVQCDSEHHQLTLIRR